MAFTKQRKQEMLKEYQSWITKSQAVFLLQYQGMTMKDVDGVRARVREIGGEVHVVKNTLLELALESAGLDKTDSYFEGTTAVGFAFEDIAGMAKLVNEITRNSEIFKVKGGYLGKQSVSAAEIKALAELPPLPVMRARLLGAISAPAAQLARTLAEPARSLAAVLKAHSEQVPA